MAVAFYFDHHVQRAILLGLRLREIDVVSAHEDGAGRYDDARLLDRARMLQRVLFTRDDDLLIEGIRRQRRSMEFSGIVYAHQLEVSIGRCVEDLEIIGKAAEPGDLLNKILFLPL